MICSHCKKEMNPIIKVTERNFTGFELTSLNGVPKLKELRYLQEYSGWEFDSAYCCECNGSLEKQEIEDCIGGQFLEELDVEFL